MKNKIVIYTYNALKDKKERLEYYNFTKVYHKVVDGIPCLTIECGKAGYEFRTSTTTISEIEIYN